ncbi:hypothetical protein [Actinomadura fibrosa]|uniref:SapB/AmfS family lantipeptide n=1 Tax=Actinomadura fibrosa TaxID=111802 RepID=A0ABW2XNL6_9ACTN|nr:hypothetical protein [Actinomadura fibrosa]
MFDIAELQKLEARDTTPEGFAAASGPTQCCEENGTRHVSILTTRG